MGFAGAQTQYFYTVLLYHLLLAFGWVLFGFFHSALASGRFKRALLLRVPGFAPFYRAAYVLFAFATLGVLLWWQLRIPSPLLLGRAWHYAGYALAGAGGLLMIICIKKYFLSLSGLKSLFRQEVVAPELRIDGVHRYVRHPLYLGTFAFVWGIFLVFPYASMGITAFFIHAYTVFALRYEEAKLVKDFGPAYQRYREAVPRLWPRFGK
ncbi:MAG: hypothetical protein EOO16_05740 [Chitinophagaceae bacterium]|nr:MAG: hypothetical protein EOO16_05740 [Chitinophagaceae bacterium]